VAHAGDTFRNAKEIENQRGKRRTRRPPSASETLAGSDQSTRLCRPGLSGPPWARLIAGMAAMGAGIGSVIGRPDSNLPVAFFPLQTQLGLFQGIVGGRECLLARGQDLFKGIREGFRSYIRSLAISSRQVQITERINAQANPIIGSGVAQPLATRYRAPVQTLSRIARTQPNVVFAPGQIANRRSRVALN